jgi:LEA14-like dessication related protein
MSRPFLLSALIVLTIAIGGCMPRFQRPVFSVVEVSATELRFDEQHFRVRLHVMNPNDRTLPVQGFHCSIEIAGQPFGAGVLTQPFQVAPRGEADFDIDLRTQLALSLPGLLERLRHRDAAIDYHLVGEVETGLAFARHIPFDQSGTVQP